MRKWLIACLIVFLLISPVAAAHTIQVDEKRIEGKNGAEIYIVGELHSKIASGTMWEEYCVSADDYDKINYGDTITLEHDAGSFIFKLTSSKPQDWW